jgi:hypothetical protein
LPGSWRHDVRIEHRDKAFAIAAPHGGEKGVDNLPLRPTILRQFGQPAGVT